jgi:hypothetical protein
MVSIRIAVLVLAGFTAEIAAAHAADLRLKMRLSHDQTTDHRRQRDNNSTAEKILYEQFLEWLKKQPRPAP